MVDYSASSISQRIFSAVLQIYGPSYNMEMEEWSLIVTKDGPWYLRLLWAALTQEEQQRLIDALIKKGIIMEGNK